ncbi:MAG: NADH-quinone oxidoreductase subunit C/D, partial [Acidobacteriota bacterium]
RLGGVAQDLPEGWDRMFREFIRYMRRRLREHETIVLANRIFQARTRGVGELTVDQAVEWGVTGPMLRACGLEWDFRKKRPYSMYDQFDFDVPTGTRGDCFDRASVHIEEIRQSLKILEQCVRDMPPGEHRSRHPLAVPPLKDPYTMHDIETLIAHFVSVSWGPVIPPGEALGAIEGTKGNNGYYLISDGSTVSYRTRIRTPSFAHMQTLPMQCRGRLVPDLLAVLGSLDFVLADIDR